LTDKQKGKGVKKVSVPAIAEFEEDYNYSGESVFDTFPWPQFAMGIATVPVAESGFAPDSRPTKISGSEMSDQRGFRRDAENCTRDACAPKTIAKIDAMAAAAREVLWVRAEALQNLKGGLRALYRALELPGASPLQAAVLAPWSSSSGGDSATRTDYSTGRAAYGFSATQDLLAQLLALNLKVAANIERGPSGTAPGVSRNHRNAKQLVTEDCVELTAGE